MLVAGVAQATDGELHSVELGHAVAHELLIVVDGSVRWIALTPRADNDKKVLGLLQVSRLGVAHVDHLGFEAGLVGRLLNSAGKFFGVTGFRTVKNGQRCFGAAWRGSSRAARGETDA